ncbi:hypothetical protein DLJ82_6112 (plasmid) [Rhizobium leguminosarum]|uniref:Uncharacterized protein n=1 Tax=Rhizobium leguminosarum TaxID=384 RepID=A0A2Z4YVD5_RHILE|nr:hypothetical protein DLJ82_6112 [Rhizobium leguminosarum]
MKLTCAAMVEAANHNAAFSVASFGVETVSAAIVIVVAVIMTELVLPGRARQ